MHLLNTTYITQMKLILIEDTLQLGAALKAALISKGHEVLWLRGVAKLEPFIAVSEDCSEIPVDVTQYDFALCDAGLEIGYHDADEVVAVLAEIGIPVIGIAGCTAGNTKLVRHGAICGITKMAGLCAILNDAIPYAEIGKRVGGGCWSLAQFEQRFAQEAGLRKQTIQFAQPFEAATEASA